MALYYTVIRQETEPSKPNPGWIWVKQSIGAAFMSIANEWIPIASGSATSEPNNVYWYSLAAQAAAPTEAVGQLWIDTDINQELIYLGSWIPLLGG